MMNSTNKALEDVINLVKGHFELVGTTIVMANQAALDFKATDVHQGLILLRNEGWRQLSILTCVDWINDSQFQLVYNIFNWTNGIRLQVRTRINRENPVFTTVTQIYPGAKYYERDVHEFFGIVFEGNPDSVKQLFLENWDDIPPLRKDFNSRAYSDKKYVKREYHSDFSEKAGGQE